MNMDQPDTAVTWGRFSPDFVRRGREALDTLAGGASSDLLLVVLLSDDGFEVCRYPDVDATDGRFASVASSVQALSEAVVHELQMGDADAMIIQASAGYVIQMRVPGHPYLFSAQFGARETIGKALAALRVSVNQFELALRDRPTTPSRD
jgi:predicted regulator of Ras-like GTPase activity (Roadblock/LC7/MglB family)